MCSLTDGRSHVVRVRVELRVHFVAALTLRGRVNLVMRVHDHVRVLGHHALLVDLPEDVDVGIILQVH